MSNFMSEVNLSVTLAVEELQQRLECVNEPQRDIIGMYLVGYSMDEIAQKHGVSTDLVESSIKSFLDSLK
jgi:DNA-directed RNA polymerase specialized sigma24 family protein